MATPMKSETELAQLPRMLAEELFDLQEAGRIMHESWTVTKREQGFHGPNEKCIAAEYDLLPCHPLARCKTFHADLIPWGKLPQKQKDINLNAFKEVFAVLAPKAESVIRRAMLEFAEQAAGKLCWWCEQKMPMDTDPTRIANGQILHLEAASQMLHTCTAVKIRQLVEQVKP